jgi:hypothetical protein
MLKEYGIDFYFEIISFLFSIFFYLKKKNKLLLYFVLFLFLTVLVEFIGGYYLYRDVRNYWIFNVFTTIEFLFYSFLFHLHFKKQSLKRLVLFFIPIFIFLILINLLFIQGFNKTFNSYTFLLGSFFIVIFCCCYFYESVLLDKIDQQLSKQAFFWICSGLLIYYLGSVIINALFEYLRNNDLGEEGKKIYGTINHTLNVILYSSFCIAFFLCPNNKKTSSSQS